MAVDPNDPTQRDPNGPDDYKLRNWYDANLHRAASPEEFSSDMEGIGKYGWDAYAGDALAKRVGSTNDRTQDSQTPGSPSATNNGAGSFSSGGSSTAQSWNNSGAASSPFPDWYKEMVGRSVQQADADRADSKARADSFYKILADRASQSLAVNPSDPIIKGQTEAFAGQQDRAARNYISDTAEQRGPLANIQGERRMASEHVGQAVGAFQADAMARELTARRTEIAQALSTQGAMLSADQQRSLQSQLALLDQGIAEANAQTSATGVDNSFTLGAAGLNTQNDQFLRQLGFNDWDRSMYYDLVQRGAL